MPGLFYLMKSKSKGRGNTTTPIRSAKVRVHGYATPSEQTLHTCCLKAAERNKELQTIQRLPLITGGALKSQ